MKITKFRLIIDLLTFGVSALAVSLWMAKSSTQQDFVMVLQEIKSTSINEPNPSLEILTKQIERESETANKTFSIINVKRFISVRNHPDYTELPRALKELVTQKAKHSKNTFYVAKIDSKLGNFTNVFWKEQNTLILLEQPTYDWKYALLWSRRYLELKKDVVPTLKDVGGSSYLLTKATWRRLVLSCLRGDRFVLSKDHK